MKGKDLINAILTVAILGIGAYFVYKCFRGLLTAFAAGASLLMILAYIFSPIIIIVLLVVVIVKLL